MRKYTNILTALILALAMVLTMLAPGVIPTAEAAGDVTINATNFPDENFRSYVSNNIDSNGDGKLSTSEIAAVTELDVGQRGITSLKGVEYFTALKLLYCYKNSLTALDVSKNTALTHINCANNSLTALDVSKNTKLDTLYCDNNQLTSLDVSKNTKLDTLTFSGNQLAAIDVSKNTALFELQCAGNQLTALDVSKNTALSYLSCRDNKLTSLDVSNNPELYYLYCYNNQLTSLDVSKNTALHLLSCYKNQLTSLDVSKNTALEELYCYSNQLKTLNVAGAAELKKLVCYSNQLAALDVSKNTALHVLSCYKNQLTSLNVSKNTALTNLQCGSNQLTSLNVSKNTALTDLQCYSNQLTAIDVSKNTALAYFSCNDNQLTALDVSKNSAIVQLNCYGNQLAELDIRNCPNLISAFHGAHQAQTSWSGVKYWYYYSLEVQGYLSIDQTTEVVTEIVKPAIKTQPADKSAVAGESVQFTVAATGGNLTYRWQYRTSSTGSWKNSGATGCNTRTLTISAATSRNGYQYRCVVENEKGKAISNAATLTVTAAAKPTITTQPKSRTTEAYVLTHFNVTATGTGLSYQWYYRTSATGTWKKSGVAGSDTASLAVEAMPYRNGYQYRCVVSNAAGSVTSSAATLTVKPRIFTQPEDQTGYVGGTAKFTVEASGDGLTYRWQYYTGSTWKNSGLTGHDTATLSVGITAARNGQQYRCVVTDKNGNKTISATAKLIVKPKITSQPSNKSTTAGTAVKFTVQATGAGLTYRWQYRTSSTGSWKNSGATGHDTATLTVTPSASMNGYQYRCVIVDANGTKLISSAATLTVK